MKSQNNYKNSFWTETSPDRKEVLTCEKPPINYKGFLIFHRLENVFDIVKDGVCIGMRAGVNGAKRKIDLLCETRK